MRGRPPVSYPPELPVGAARDEIAAAIRDAPGRHRLRRDRLGQDDADSEDLPRARRGVARPDRSHAAAAHRRAQRRHAHREELGTELRRRGRLQGALHRSHQARRLHQADDRRHPARRDAGRPLARRVRHHHRRRGARAQPQHRFPARVSEAAAAAASRSEGDHHLGDPRCGALCAPFRHGGSAGACASKSRAASFRSRCAIARSATARGDEADDEEELEEAIVAAAEELWREGPATSWCSCPASARSARPPICCAKASRGGRTRTGSRYCRCTRACPSTSSSACSRRSDGRRIVLATNVAETSLTVPGHPLRDRLRARAHQALFAAQQDDAAADREDLAGRGRTSARAAAAASPRASACGSTAKTISPRGRNTPSPRSCARRWPR